MAGPYPLATLAPTITPTGITAPSYADILASLQASYQAIFGSDVQLDDSSQDGQWLAVIAFAINAANNACIACYNAYSPTTAVGAGLSSVVKINNLQRNVATNSTAVLTIGGTAGTEIRNGQVSDAQGNTWNLPALVVIPNTGTIEVTGTCATEGDINAPAGTISTIQTPTRGWQTVTNAADAEPGSPVESDAALRQRQSISTALPAQSTLQAIAAGVANLSGVSMLAAYENSTTTTDGNGAPAHSVYLVVTGGVVSEIVDAIGAKTLGQPTYGTTSGTFTDPNGVSKTVNFFETTQERLVVNITLAPKLGYLDSTGDAIVAQVQAFVAGLGIGQNVQWFNLAAATILPDPNLAATYDITAVTACLFGGSPGTSDVAIAFNQKANLATADVTLTVT